MQEIIKPYQENGLIIDIGTGDGNYIFRQAQKNPHTFFIGIDSNAENLRERSHKAYRSMRKGNLNLLYVHAAAESLPAELEGLASHISILLPWGSLLQAAAGQNISILKNMAKLCCDKATIRVIFGYESSVEQKMIDVLKLPALTTDYLTTTLSNAYYAAGFSVTCRILKKDELKNLDTTWAKKLAYGKERQFVEITGIFNAS